MSSPLPAIHLVTKVGRESFGLGAAVLNLVGHQIQQGHNSMIWCLDQPEEVEWARQLSHLVPSQLLRFNTSGPAFIGYTPEMERAARDARQPDIVHQHGIWTGLSRVTNEWRRHRRVITVVGAHGALNSWGLRKSAWKKGLALFAYESQNLREATCLHACGENEISDYREYSLKAPVAYLPNGVSTTWVDSSGDPMRFRKANDVPDDLRIILYLGRITPTKGLPLLLEAMHELRRRLQSWILLIAGVDQCGYQHRLQTQVSARGLERYVRFIGPKYGQEKRDAFAAADLFVLPTRGEGSPVAILEALGAGVPVLTTKGVPWSDLARHDCGWWTDISAGGIHDALQVALELPKAALAAAGQRGRQLVAQNYNWAETASKSLRLYDWLRGRGPTPEFVHFA